MLTWEDWDYWLRMAKAGRCFSRLEKPYIIYNYISGNRREIGRQIWADVLQYLKDKHNKVKIMGCGCGNMKKTISGKISTAGENQMEVWYIHPNRGRHPVVVNGTNYGRHVGGRQEHFPVNDADALANPNLFEPFEQLVIDPAPGPQAMVAPKPIAPPEAIITTFESETVDMSSLSDSIRNKLIAASLTTKTAIIDTGLDGLIMIKGVGPSTAKQIMQLAEKT